MKFNSSCILFTDDSVRGKQTVISEIDKVKYYDPTISELFVDRSFPYKSGILSWANRAGVDVNYGEYALNKSNKNHGRVVVVYVGFTRQSIHYNRAVDRARNLDCELIILP